MLQLVQVSIFDEDENENDLNEYQQYILLIYITIIFSYRHRFGDIAMNPDPIIINITIYPL